MADRIDNPLVRRPVLVLNKNWQAVHVTNVARAITLVFAKEARVVDPRNYATYGWDEWLQADLVSDTRIRSARLSIAVPDVILLACFDQLPRAAVHFSRRNILQRDRCTCQFCGAQPGVAELTIDHVVPRAQGGPTNWENCVAACWVCNRDKADRTPKQAGMTLRRTPNRPDWMPLFSAKSANPRWSRFMPSRTAG